MRRRHLSVSVLLLVTTGCPTQGNEGGNDRASDLARGDDEGAPVDGADGPGEASDTDGDTDGEAAVPIAIDDENRFVKADLDAFMEKYPAVLRTKDEARFRTCLGDACLDHGVSDTVTPFVGPGVRYLVPLWLRGCMSGSAKACLFAGRSYQGSQYTAATDGRAVHEDMPADELQARFRRYIQRACRLDETECEQWADFTLGDEAPAEADVARAIERLKEGCDREEHGACAALARHAADHPDIGAARLWWQRACALETSTDRRSCSRYAEVLLGTGADADRAAASDALGPTCDPGSDMWATACKGDAAAGREACASTYLHAHGAACLAVVRDAPRREALRVSAALCVSSLLDETNALGRRACERARQLATALGEPASFLSALDERRCAVDEMDCLSASYDLRRCGELRDACEARARRAGG